MSSVLRRVGFVAVLAIIFGLSSGIAVNAPRSNFYPSGNGSSESEVKVIVNNITVERTTPTAPTKLTEQVSDSNYNTSHQHQRRYPNRKLKSRQPHTKVVGSRESRTVLRQNQGFIEYPPSTTDEGCVNHVRKHSWLIETENGQEVSLTFSEFSMTGVRPHDQQCRGFNGPSIEIYDGSSEQHPDIASFCGDRHPSYTGNFRSTNKQLLIVAKIPCEVIDGGSNQLHFKAEFIAENLKAELNEEPSAIDVQDEAGFPCGRPSVKSNVFNRVVGGTEAAAHSWPWQVSIRKRSFADSIWHENEDKPEWTHNCGGSLINSRWVVTAAHCVRNPWISSTSDIRIVLGEHSLVNEESTERIVGVERWFVHENYVSVQGNDIALIRLAENITFNDYISPICLPKDTPSVDMFCVATGWGMTSEIFRSIPDKLQQFRIPIQPIEFCERILNVMGEPVDEVKGILCAGYSNVAEGSCYGDSGGPVACLSSHPRQFAANSTTSDVHWTLYGLTSAGVKCADYIDFPGTIYTDVAYFKPWIMRTISDFEQHDSVTEIAV